jgi:hypothetical protein
MIRFALILLMSLGVNSQAVATAKWNNSVIDQPENPLRKDGKQFEFVTPPDVMLKFRKTPIKPSRIAVIH